MLRPITDAAAFAKFGDPRDSLDSEGVPTEAWLRKHLVYVTLPAPLPASWNRAQKITRLRTHRLVAPHLRSALLAIHAMPAAWATIDDCGGVYNFRAMIGSKKRLSRHALAIAIDLDVRDNPFLGFIPRVDARVKSIMLAHGFAWGGWTGWGGSFPWSTRDAMHWEFADLGRLA